MLSRVAVSIVLLGLAAGVTAAKEKDITLTSDQMELLESGQKTVFSGHVVLKKQPYVLRADRMIRTDPEGLVEADGRVTGTWTGPQGEKTQATGQHARYDPKTETAELWTDSGRQVKITWKGPRGSGQLLGNRAILYLASKKARMVERVTGHIVPAP